MNIEVIVGGLLLVCAANAAMIYVWWGVWDDMKW
tara:strand:- start:7698 stop:7799 length:102 start_codon:yes stop_codon:yes gene_type:complete